MKYLKSIFYLTLLQVLLVTNLLGQTFQPSEAKLYQSLIGTVHTLSLFVDTEEEGWEEEEMNYFYGELEKSQAWLQEEASFYDQHLAFENNFFLENKNLISLFDVNRGSTQDIKRRAMEALGYTGINDFLQRNNFDLEKNKLKLLLFVKSSSRSHAYNYWSNSTVDVAVIYCGTRLGAITDHYVISHELLHQFGAWDLYFGQSQSQENAEKAKELFPNSVMINTHRNKEDLEVDELTAWRVGWHYNFEEVYNEFVPDYDPEREWNKYRANKKGNTIEFDLKRKKDDNGKED